MALSSTRTEDKDTINHKFRHCILVHVLTFLWLNFTFKDPESIYSVKTALGFLLFMR